MPSLLQRHQPASAIDVHVLPGSASCEQVGEAAAARGASVMTGSLASKAAWGCRRSDAEHKDAAMRMSHDGSILLATLMISEAQKKVCETFFFDNLRYLSLFFSTPLQKPHCLHLPERTLRRKRRQKNFSSSHCEQLGELIVAMNCFPKRL